MLFWASPTATLQPYMATSLFTYGTLLFPDIMQAITGRALPSEQATLHGYQRYRVRGRVYPGLTVEQLEVVEGRLYRGVDLALWERLDAFEGDLYERIVVPVAVSRGLVAAHVYVMKASHQSELSDEVWDADAFQSIHKRSYLAACRGAVHADVASRHARLVTR